jgi:hypothetical protein
MILGSAASLRETLTEIRGVSRLPPQYVDREAGMCCSQTSGSYSASSLGGVSSILLHTVRRSSLFPSVLDDPPVVTMVDEESVE